MSDEEDWGGPAFPCERHQTQDGTWNTTFEQGMFLRDWFAGQALCGILANEGIAFDQEEKVADAVRLYAMADAMLAARIKR